MIWPPFAVLGVGAPIAFGIGWLLSRSLRGDFINLDVLGWFIAAGGYTLFAALLLWIDSTAVRHLPDRAWASRDQMWSKLMGASFLALVGAVVFGFGVIGAATAFALAKLEMVAIVGIPSGLIVAVAWGGVRDVRARRAARVLLDPPT